MSWLPQEQVGNAFLAECLRIVENAQAFETFKTNETFCKVIGNDVLPRTTTDILYANIENDPFVLNKLSIFQTNDIFGGAPLHNYQLGEISSGTLYFLNILKSLRGVFGDLTDFDIVEIGSGYGGQAKILIDSDVKSYSCVDLPETLQLCNKYLNLFNHDVNYYVFPDVPERKYDLVISNWCFSEFSEKLMEFYFERLIKNCARGYFLMNEWQEEKKQFILSLCRKFFDTVEVYPEYPKTHPNDNWLLILKK